MTAKDKHALFLEYDGGRLTEVARYQIRGKSADGSLNWRLVSPDGSALSVRPLQLETSASPLCMPSSIEPALRAAGELIRWVHGLIITRDSPETHPDSKRIEREAAAQVGRLARDRRDSARRELRARAQKENPTAWRDRFREESGGEEALRGFIYGELVKQHRDEAAGVWEAAKAEGERHRAAAKGLMDSAKAKLEEQRERYYRDVSLYEINRFLQRHAGKAPVRINSRPAIGYTRPEREAILKKLNQSKWLGEARRFILKECRPAGDEGHPIIPASECLKLTEFIGKQARCDPRLSVMKAFSPEASSSIKAWRGELRQARKLTAEQAEKYITERVHYIAQCTGLCGVELCPVENIAKDVEMEEETAAVAPLAASDRLAVAGAKATLGTNDLGLEYWFKDVGSHFSILWEGVNFTAGKPGAGMEYLKVLLGESGREWDPTELYAAVRGKSVPGLKTSVEDLKAAGIHEVGDLEAVSQADRAAARKNLENLEQTYRSLEQRSMDIEQASSEGGAVTGEQARKLEKTEKDMKEIMKEIEKQNRMAKGKASSCSGDSAKNRGNIQRVINLGLKELRESASDKNHKAIHAFDDHIRRNIMNGFVTRIIYDPDPMLAINWQT